MTSPLARAEACLDVNDLAGARAALDAHDAAFPDGPEWGRASLVRVRLGLITGHADEARALAAEVVRRAEAGGWPCAGEALMRVADCDLALRRHEASAAIARRVHRMAQRSGDAGLRADAAFVLASAANIRGDHARAATWYTAAADGWRSIGQGRALTAALRRLGFTLLRLGRTADAVPVLEDAVALAASRGDTWQRADLHRLLAEAALTGGDDAGAERWVDAALATADDLDDPSLRYRAFTTKGEIARYRGDLDAAERWYRAALRNVRGEAGVATYVNLALVAALRGDAVAVRDRLAELEGRLRPMERDGLAGVIDAIALCGTTPDDPAWEERLASVAELEARSTVEPDALLALTLASRRLPVGSAVTRSRAIRSWALVYRLAAVAGRPTDEAEGALRRLATGGGVPLGAVELVDPVGRGGMGTVWEAVHRTTGTRVAVKVLTPDHGADAARRRAFSREIGAAAGVVHPNLVRVLDAGTVDPPTAIASGGALLAGSPYVVMAFADRGTLRSRRGALAWPAVARVLDALLAGLASAHARGVVHCDVKPSNVLLAGPDAADGAPREVWLADFGLARAAGGTGGLAGTPAYMAPEQFPGAADRVGPAADLYAVGCVACALTCGAPPFGHSNPSLLRHGHRYGTPRIAPELAVPTGFVGWTARLLAKAPVDRWPSAAAARQALAALGPAVGERTAVRWAGVAAPTLDLDDLDAVLQETVGGPDLASHPLALPLPVPERWPAAPAVTPSPATGPGVVPLREPPLVGRDAERAFLWDALREVTATGVARHVVIGGAAGLGRSRLVHAFAERLRAAGVARALVLDVSDEPAVDWARRVFRQLGAAGDGWLPDPDVAARVEQALAGCELPPTLLGEALRAWSRGWPIVVVLDDLDTAPGLADVPARLTALPHPVLVVSTALGDAGDRVLGPLDDAAIGALLDGLLPLADDVRRGLVARADGNPQLAVQLLEDQVARGGLRPGRAGWYRPGGAPLALPDALGATWRARVDRLVEGLPDGPMALKVAALLGRVVEADTWGAAAAAAGVVVPADLTDRLRGAGLVVGTAQRWRFAHGALREWLVAEADRAGVAPMLHLACAEVRSGGPRGRHLLLAGEPASAAPLLLEAARAALDVSAPRSARRWLDLWRRAADALGLSAAEQVVGLLMNARICGIVGDAHAADAASEEALAAARAAADPTVLARAWLVRGNALFHRGRVHQAAEAWRRAEAHPPGTLIHARAQRWLASWAALAGRPAEAAERLRIAIATFDDHGEALQARIARERLATVLHQLGRIDEAVALNEAVYAAHRDAGDRPRMGTALCNLGELARAVGDLPRARALYAESHALLAGAGLSGAAHTAAVNLAIVRDLLGDDPRADLERLVRTADAQGRQAHADMARAVLLPMLVDADDAVWAAALEGTRRRLAVAPGDEDLHAAIARARQRCHRPGRAAALAALVRPRG